MTDWAARVLDQLDADRSDIVASLVEVVRTPSVTGTDAEHELSAMLAGVLRRDGLDVDHWRIDLDDLAADPDFPGTEAPRSEAWGLVGRLAGRDDGPSLLLDGHIDVVPPGHPGAWADGAPFSARIADGQLHGRGACDMKAGLVAAIAAARAVRRAGVPLRGDLLLACVQGEEDGGLGTFATLRRGWRADACVIPEPTGLHLIPANGGALTFRLHVTGRSAHAARRTEGVSALDRLWPVLRALRALEYRRNREVDPLMRSWPIAYPISIGTVHAGDWASTVPDRLVAEGRHGVALDEPIDDARRAFEAAVAEACDSDPWLRSHPVTVEWWGGQFGSGRCVPDSDLPDRIRRAHAAAGGGRQEQWGAPYGSDLRLLTGLAGIPTVQYGPGDAALAHAVDESVPLDDVHTAARTLALLALDVCGTA